jgi:hypothetical protein
MPTRPTTRLDEQEVAARHAELQAAVARKRMREEIEEMEMELAGAGRRRVPSGSPAPSRSSGGDILVRARALAPPVFTGKTLGELRRYLQGCSVYFDAIAEHDEARRVATAASYLRDEALSQWMRLAGDKPASWLEYERTLRDMVQDPMSRMGDALLAVKQAQQRPSETARELANRLEELEEDIPILSVEQLRAWTLLNSLRLDLRVAVLREERVISTRTQVVATAQRLEMLGMGKPEITETKTSARASAGAAQTKSTGDETRTCYICSELGHIARHCPKKDAKKQS